MISILSLPVPVLIIHQHSNMPHTHIHEILVNFGYPEDVILHTSDLSHATQLIEQHLPNLILCAVEDFDDLVFLQSTQKIHPEAHLISLHSSIECDDILIALKSGAHAYLLSSSEAEQLAAHIRIILRGGAILHPQLASYLLNTHLTSPAQITHTHSTALAVSHIAYSPIEIQILQQFAHAQTLEQTATLLQLSTAQVSNLVKQILRKVALHH